jgi:hypothetical protein
MVHFSHRLLACTHFGSLFSVNLNTHHDWKVYTADIGGDSPPFAHRSHHPVWYKPEYCSLIRLQYSGGWFLVFFTPATDDYFRLRVDEILIQLTMAYNGIPTWNCLGQKLSCMEFPQGI